MKQLLARLLFLPAGLSRVQPECVCPGRAVEAVATLLLTVAVVASEGMPAQEKPATEFTPPGAYPIERYESGWQKNPFGLKTAPVTPEKVSFARDWILAGCFGEEGDPMVVLANTKTRERLRLKKGEPASNGMSLHSVTFSASRKDTVAEVSMGDATAVLRFDDDSLKNAKGKGKPGAPAVAGSKASDGLAISPAAAGDVPVASVPSDQGSGFPYSYENSDNKDKGTVASGGAVAADSSSGGGRKRMLTALKPVGGGK